MVTRVGIMQSRRNLIILRVGQITLTGSTIFGIAAMAFLVWFWFDHTE